ncbi:MAG: hypothetical protein OQK79_07025 [Rhodanobacter sp.]|jgi:hypothetical protein|nr:hypothetical protein [Rhodanobacter sp.]
MISQTQLDELKKLHKDHIANTFLFTNKVLDQRRRINDAQAEVIHGLLQDLAKNAAIEGGKDPALMAQNAMRQLSESVAKESARSSDFLKETAAAYAEIMRLTMSYSTDTFVGLQTAGRDAVRTKPSASASDNPWVDTFISTFENAANLMNTGLKPMMGVVGSPRHGHARGHAADERSAGGAKAASK